MDITINVIADGLEIKNSAERDMLSQELTRAVSAVLDTYAARNKPIDSEVCVEINADIPEDNSKDNSVEIIDSDKLFKLRDFQYKFASGWTARREFGLVTLPETTKFSRPGAALFAQNRWVLRNGDNDVVDLHNDRMSLFDAYPESNDWLDIEPKD